MRLIFALKNEYQIFQESLFSFIKLTPIFFNKSLNINSVKKN